MHADERHRRLSQEHYKDVFTYHMHISYVPVVEKEILWTKRVKDKSLVGTVKERINQISHSKKWWTRKKLDENGDVVYKTDKHGNIKLNQQGKPKPELESAYSGLQDRIYQHMTDAGFPALTRGEKGSRKKHLHHEEYKAQQEALRAEQERLRAENETNRANRAAIDADLAQDRAEFINNRTDQAVDELHEINRQSDEAYEELQEIERLIEEKGTGLHEAERLNPQAVKIAMDKIVADYHEQERRNAATKQPEPVAPIRRRQRDVR